MKTIKHIATAVSLTLFMSNCATSQGNRVISVVVDPKNSGWYFVQMIQDSVLVDTTRMVYLLDSVKMKTVHVKDIHKIILKPFDQSGNDLSDRLKDFMIAQTDSVNYVAEFYNPTEIELQTIDSWDVGKDPRAIKMNEARNKEFDRYFHWPAKTNK